MRTKIQKALDALKLLDPAVLWKCKQDDGYIYLDKYNEAKKKMAAHEPFTSLVFNIILLDDDATVPKATYDYIEKNLYKVIPVKKGWMMPVPPDGYSEPVVRIWPDGVCDCCWFSEHPENLDSYEGQIYPEKDQGIEYPWIEDAKPDQIMWEALEFTVIYSEWISNSGFAS